MNVRWLPEQGYQVFLLDYRGYGMSEGEPELPEVFDDIQLGKDWLVQSGRLQKKPLIVFGQSLGASMSSYVFSRPENRADVSCIILEAGFSDYSDIVNDIMKRSWLLWLPRFALVPTIPDRWDPEDVIADIQAPLLILHSPDDRIIPYAHARRLMRAASSPKQFIEVAGPHGASGSTEAGRFSILKFMHEECL